jgi:hypothetical protein
MPDVSVLIIGVLIMGGIAALNLNWRNKGNMGVNPDPGVVCGHCTIEEHKDCRSLDCQCKNDVCTEIRKKRWAIDALVVGQDVYLYNGCHWGWGKVVRLYPEGIFVQPHQELQQSENWTPQADVELWFDYEGNSRDGQGTLEGGAWRIDDMPFAERRKGHV